MNSYFVKIYFAVVFLGTSTLFGQLPQNSKFPERKRLIDKVEIFFGPGLYLPNDHGWAEYLFKGSDGQIIYKANSEIGHSIGISLIHSINKRFELHGKISLERKRYSEGRVYLDLNGKITSESETEQKNDHLVISLVPVYFTSELSRLHIFAGISYAHLTRSLAFDTAGGGAPINTIDGFQKHVFDALAGVGYLFPISKRFKSTIRIQGNHALAYTLHQNNQSISINSLSLSFAIRYIRKSLL